MSVRTYKRFANESNKEVPQSEPLPGQVANNAGGNWFPVDSWKRLERFLILGSSGGTYYVSEKKLTRENANAILECVASDPKRTIDEIVRVSQRGLAPNNDPALFALALATMKYPAGFSALPLVARTGTHLLHFVAFAQGMRGWGRSLKIAVRKWYEEKPAKELAYQMAKYQGRDGWTHSDVLSLAHVQADKKDEDEAHKILYHWAVKGWDAVGPEEHPVSDVSLVWAFERAKRAVSAREVVGLIEKYDLPRECIPTNFLTEKSVWEALLAKMPYTAMIRNLATMTRVGLFDNFSTWIEKIEHRLRDGDRIRRARIHPFNVLVAQKIYGQGRGLKSVHTWNPIPRLVAALDDAFMLSFGNVVPSGKRLLIAIDVSGSMGYNFLTSSKLPFISCREAAAVQALVFAKTEPNYLTMAFATEFTPLAITKNDTLESVIGKVSNIPMGGTDCAIPMLYAAQHNQTVDGFVILTDGETWAGPVHPYRALEMYRQKSGIGAKLVDICMTTNGGSLGDQSDDGCLDVVGFSTTTPTVVQNFLLDNAESPSQEEENEE